MGHTTMKKTILALSVAVAAACFGQTDRALADNITVKDGQAARSPSPIPAGSCRLAAR